MKQRITSLAVALTFLHSQIAYALPVKNNASNGVQFNKNQNTLNITAPDKSVINYDSFNIAANEAVNFVQPGASSSVLNRVLSGGASTINGALAANGNVLLVNPSGVMFGGGATVNANSFIASTKNITDANFQAGLLKFEGSTSGTIVNNGLINGSTNVGLIAANIENKGTIKAGKNAGLIAGNTGSVSVDFDGDGLINFTADSSTIGSGTIENSGTIKAGQVLLTANDVSNVLENVINNTGTIEATKAVAGENGAIQLISDASVKNTGNLKAPAGKITINTGGDMNSKGTISAVDGEVDIEATGDVTSSGTLEAGKLTEKGATFGISGTFSVDESSLKNDDDAIEFTGDTTLTGNISDVDNIIVGGGVTLTLAADVTLTAGADTSSNTNVNDTSNIVTSTGGDFIWMADNAVIEGAGFNLTFDTKGTNSWLTSINGVNDLTFLNGNTDKVSNTVTYELKKDITTTGTFTIGEGTSLQLYPIDALGAVISDITLTADNFAVGGIGENAGSIKLNNKNLTLDATSTTTDSSVNFYVTDQANNTSYSTGSLAFLGHSGTKFDIGVANNDATDNIIMTKGINVGNSAGRVANINLSNDIEELSSGADSGAAFNIYGNSGILLNRSTTIAGSSIQMDADAFIGTNPAQASSPESLNFYATQAGESNISNLNNINGLSFYSRVNGVYNLTKDIDVSSAFIISDNTSLKLNSETSEISLKASFFDYDWGGNMDLNGNSLTLDATSNQHHSFMKIDARDVVNGTFSTPGYLKLLGDPSCEFVINFINAPTSDLSVDMGNITLGDDAGRSAKCNFLGVSELSTGVLSLHNDSDFNVYEDITINGNIQMDHESRICLTSDSLTLAGTGTSTLSTIVSASNLLLQSGDYNLTKDLSVSNYLWLGSGVKLTLDPKDSAGLDASDIALSAYTFRTNTSGEYDLNNKNVTFTATNAAENHGLNFYSNQADGSAFSTGSLSFLRAGGVSPTFALNVGNQSGNRGNKLSVNGVNIGNDVKIDLGYDLSELSSSTVSGDLNMDVDTMLIAHTDLNLSFNEIHMYDSTAVINANNHDLTLCISGGSSYRRTLLGKLSGTKNLNLLAYPGSTHVSYTLRDTEYSADIFRVGEGVVLTVDSPMLYEDMLFSASYFLFEGTGFNAGSIDLEKDDLILDASSTTVDSIVNFYMKDDGLFTPEGVTFLGNNTTKYLVGVANDASPDNHILQVDYFSIGDESGRIANVELLSTVGELETLMYKYQTPSLRLHGDSSLTLNTDSKISSRIIGMDAVSTIDANLHNITLSSESDSTLGTFTNLLDFTLLDAVEDGSQIQYNLLSDTIDARNVNLGADVKLRGTNAVTTINTENLSMLGNSQLNAWDSSGNHNSMVLNVSNAATLGELFFVDNFTLTGGATFTEISWQDTWDLGGNFTLGENTTLASDGNLTINALDAIVMNIGSSIIMNNNSNLTLKALNSSTLYDLNAGTGDIILEGTGATPTSYSENGAITCSNNNTPTYINAN